MLSDQFTGAEMGLANGKFTVAWLDSI